MQPSLWQVTFDPIKLKEGKTLCPCCKRPMKAYGYELNKELVSIAVEIMRWCIWNKQYKFLTKEIFEENHKSLTQFQKLQYFGIIKKCEKSMQWFLTIQGYDFLLGKIRLPQKAWVFRNKVISFDEELINVQKAQPNWKSYFDFLQDYILVPYQKLFYFQ